MKFIGTLLLTFITLVYVMNINSNLPSLSPKLGLQAEANIKTLGENVASIRRSRRSCPKGFYQRCHNQFDENCRDVGCRCLPYSMGPTRIGVHYCKKKNSYGVEECQC